MKMAFTSFINVVEQSLSHRTQIPGLIRFLREFPERLDIYFGELNAAIRLFNRYQPKTFGIPLINANHLREVIGSESLPDSLELLTSLFNSSGQPTQDLIATLESMDDFEFIDTLSPPSILAPAFIFGWYRTYLRIIHPDWVVAKVQIASALEEMLAVLAIEGTKTHIFKATKQWLLDWQGEGFDPAFSKAVKSIT